ncbi:hypothetical protein ACH5RR_032209, partial [Cinchona calisaya]
ADKFFPFKLSVLKIFNIFTPKKKMNYRKAATLLMVLVIFVAIMSHVHVEAARLLTEEASFGANHLDTFPSVYEKAKVTMSYWLERLASGPSPRGPGH